MTRIFQTLILCGFAPLSVAQTMTLSLTSDEFQVSPVYSNVDEFTVLVEIDTPLAVGTFNNPDIVEVMYTVTGDLAAGTPSGFPGFALVRTISGSDFYAQGSSLSFDIASNAVLDDGVQMAELGGNGIVFSFDGREVGNGRFHPALLELNADGSGRIQNSNNIVTEVPLQQVAFGEEYITDLQFDPGNTTLIEAGGNPPVNRRGGSGAMTGIELLLGVLVAAFAVRARRAGRPA